MEISVRVFAGLRDLIGHDRVDMKVDGPVSVRTLRQELIDSFPTASAALERVLIARNHQYAQEDELILETDEVGLIPPVSGGSPDVVPSCLVSREPLSVERAFQVLENVYHGGTVIFCGTVREWTRGRQTDYLVYEAYEEMALLQMRQIEEEIKAEWPGVMTLQWHRIGRLDPSDVAVICAASSPHRDTAFLAARALIDRLKQRVPIWKNEFYSDGESTWQANPEAKA